MNRTNLHPTQQQSTFTVGFSLASVWFGTHVGSGFATGNQAMQYFVTYGWTAAILPFLSMLLLAYIMREAVIMARSQNVFSYKDLICHLWQPYPKMELTFEFFYFTIVFAAVGSVIAGAASLFEDIGVEYRIAVLIVGILLLALTIFGAKLVAKASMIMSSAILLASMSIYTIGIAAHSQNMLDAMTITNLPKGYLNPLWATLIYASFQVVSLPAVIACSHDMKNKRQINMFFLLGFLMNGLALGLSCWLLLSWQTELLAQGDVALPNLFICTQLGYAWLYYSYFIALFLAMISTGVNCIFALVVRLENSLFKNPTGIMANLTARRILISSLTMSASMAISLLGLSKIVKYGYGLCGYIALLFVVIPVLTIGIYKNRQFLRANPRFFDE